MTKKKLFTITHRVEVDRPMNHREYVRFLQNQARIMERSSNLESESINIDDLNVNIGNRALTFTYDVF